MSARHGETELPHTHQRWALKGGRSTSYGEEHPGWLFPELHHALHDACSGVSQACFQRDLLFLSPLHVKTFWAPWCLYWLPSGWDWNPLWKLISWSSFEELSRLDQPRWDDPFSIWVAPVLELGFHTEYNGASERSIIIRCFLFPVSKCHVTSCLLLLMPYFLNLDRLYPLEL